MLFLQLCYIAMVRSILKFIVSLRVVEPCRQGKASSAHATICPRLFLPCQPRRLSAACACSSCALSIVSFILCSPHFLDYMACQQVPEMYLMRRTLYCLDIGWHMSVFLRVRVSLSLSLFLSAFARLLLLSVCARLSVARI